MIVSAGEAVVDFLPATDGAGRACLRPVTGGSSFNVAIGLGRLGCAAGFMGGLSTDIFGAMFHAELERSNVSDRYVAFADDPSTLAFVGLGTGEPSFAIFDRASAGRLFAPARVPALGAEVRALHVASYSLVVEPVGGALRSLAAANRGRRFVSVDPNIRPAVIAQDPDARAKIEATVAAADLVKTSLADLAWLRPGQGAADAADAWLRAGAGAVAITQGAEGASLYAGGGAVLSIPGRRVAAVDTVGAGDAFMAGLLAALERDGLLRPGVLAAGAADRLAPALAFAVAAAALSCTRPGSDPPWLHELAAER